MEKATSGKKIAAFVVSIIAIACILVVILIQTFYATYDPSKYGRSNGGVDQGTNSTEINESNEK